MSIVVVQGLTKTFGRKKTIEDISFKVESGEFFGIIGPDKAGKSTILNILMDFIPPSKGSAEIFRLNCQEESDEIKKDIGFIPAFPGFYDNMKISKILRMVKKFYPDNYDPEYEKLLCERFKINPKKKAGQLTYSAQKRLCIVTALMHKPKLIIMDEPTVGLDPIMYNRFYETLFELKEKGTSAIVTAQHLGDIESICDVATILREGEIIETKKISHINKNRGKFIHVSVEGDISEMMLSLGAKEYMKKNGVVSFIYKSDVNRLIKSLAKFKIDDLKMEDLPIESEFSSYNDTIFIKEEELLPV